MKSNIIGDFIKERRKKAGLTQVELASKAGVGVRFVSEIESGKQTSRIDTINKVLALFGKYLGPVDIPRE